MSLKLDVAATAKYYNHRVHAPYVQEEIIWNLDTTQLSPYRMLQKTLIFILQKDI